MKIFTAALLAIAVSAGSADARVASTANPHKYFPRCAEGMTGASACVTPRLQQAMGSFVVPDNIATLLMVFAGSSAPLGAVAEILSGAICA
ncbi:MAG: hypothetical protein WBD95_15710 [Xanthobacteraceae bacterium]